jgi:hypothetical protein
MSALPSILAINRQNLQPATLWLPPWSLSASNIYSLDFPRAARPPLDIETPPLADRWQRTKVRTS